MDRQDSLCINCGMNEEDRRLDRVIRKTFVSMPLSLIQKSIRTGTIKVNGQKKTLGYRLRKGDVITVSPALISLKTKDHSSRNSPPLKEIQSLPKSAIISENSHLLFVHKKAGILVHGENSLLLQVLAYLGRTPGEESSFTPGPLHRLDRNSSGIVAFGKTAPGARRFSELLKRGGISKYYLALVDGAVKKKQVWRDSLSRNSHSKKSFISKENNGKKAVLSVQPLLTAHNRTLLLVGLVTGRTHQVRVQCSSHGHPLSGDLKYGGSRCKEGFFLHAYALKFESTDDIIDNPFIRVLPSFPMRKRLQQVFGFKQVDSLFRKIDTLISS